MVVIDINAINDNQKYRGISCAIFFVVLIAELIGGYYFMYLKGYIMGDGLSRTANAFYVLAISPPRLASIGFVWNPLPSLLQLPLLLLRKVFPPLATHGLAGSVVCAFFAAYISVFLFKRFKYYNIHTSAALVLTAAYAFNPFIFYYGCNGMSEIPFFFTMIVCVADIARWYENRSSLDLSVIAFALAVSFLCRYEAIPFGISLGIAIVLIIFLGRDEQSDYKKKSFKMKLDYTVATSIVVFLPAVYTVLFWVLANWVIMGNPTYFLNSVYSNTSQSTYAQNFGVLQKAMTSQIDAIFFMLTKIAAFIPLFIAMTIERLLTKRILKLDYWILVILIATISAFHYVMFIGGKSFGWLRFYSFALPISMAWIPYELSKLGKAMKKIAVVMFATAIISSSLIALNYWKSDMLAPEEYEAFVLNDTNGVAKQMALARRINERYSDSIVLIDSFLATATMLNVDHPENIICTASENFDEALKNPSAYRVNYVVAHTPGGVGNLDAVNIAYPNLYYDGADGFVERETLDDAKIFEVMY